MENIESNTATIIKTGTEKLRDLGSDALTGADSLTKKAKQVGSQAVDDAIGGAKQVFSDATDRATDVAENLYLEMYDVLKKNPGQAIGLVFLAGVSLGAFIGRASKAKS